jgi:2-haloacid dehalogenase
MKPRAFIFDAYGTLFDVHSFVLRCDDVPGDLRALAALWRRKQFEYTWLRSLMERYEDFWKITSAALHSSVSQLGIAASDAQLDRLLHGYLCAGAHRDARPALESLASAPLVILSNGSPTMLDSVVRNSGLKTYFTEIISVDRVNTYKPSPQAYALGSDILNLPAKEILCRGRREGRPFPAAEAGPTAPASKPHRRGRGTDSVPVSKCATISGTADLCSCLRRKTRLALAPVPRSFVRRASGIGQNGRSAP